LKKGYWICSSTSGGLVVLLHVEEEVNLALGLEVNHERAEVVTALHLVLVEELDRLTQPAEELLHHTLTALHTTRWSSDTSYPTSSSTSEVDVASTRVGMGMGAMGRWTGTGTGKRSEGVRTAWLASLLWLWQDGAVWETRPDRRTWAKEKRPLTSGSLPNLFQNKNKTPKIEFSAKNS
jgi:hypothetical protein